MSHVRCADDLAVGVPILRQSRVILSLPFLQIFANTTSSASTTIKIYRDWRTSAYGVPPKKAVAPSDMNSQPVLAARTRPYHYHSFNLTAMIVCSGSPLPPRASDERRRPPTDNGRLGGQVGFDARNLTPPSVVPDSTTIIPRGCDDASGLYPSIGAAWPQRILRHLPRKCEPWSS